MLEGCRGQCNLSCSSQLEETILQAGPENVAAFVAEPIVQGSIAVVAPPQEYFPLIREVCDRYDVLFIADEIITAWDRTGKYFAMEHWEAVPDMIVFAKGISSGYCPLGGVLLRDRIRDSFASSGESFAHIFTYVDNPVAMRAGLAVLDILEEENILQHVLRMGEYLKDRSQELRRHSIVGEIRSHGLMMGVELVRDATSAKTFPPDWKIKKRLARILLEKGLSPGSRRRGSGRENRRRFPAGSTSDHHPRRDRRGASDPGQRNRRTASPAGWIGSPPLGPAERKLAVFGRRPRIPPGFTSSRLDTRGFRRRESPWDHQSKKR